MLKIPQGGWVPLLLGASICCVMLVWQAGNNAVQKQADEMQIPISDIVARIVSGDVRRVPGTAVFVARFTRDVPPIVVWHLRHIRSLHDSIVIVNVVTELIPYVVNENQWRCARSPRGCGERTRILASWSSQISRPCCSVLTTGATRWIPPT
jgi:KUP system potassium uptake protein